MAAVLLIRDESLSASLTELLLESGARPDSGLDGEVWFPLSASAHLGRRAAVTALLASGADATRAGRHAATALMRVAAVGDSRTAALLLREGDSKALVGFRDLQGMSPLLRAAEKGHAGVVEVLLKHAADVSERVISTFKVRHSFDRFQVNESIEYEHSDLAREAVRAEHGESALESALVALRSDVGARRGATPLALAARSGSIDTVK